LTHFRLLILVVLSFYALSGIAVAETFEVELVVPAELRPLLESHLQIMHERQDPKLSKARFRFLARIAPDEIRALLATEGYFSPSVEQSVTAIDTGWRARVTVEPGEPSRIASVSLEYQGAFAEEAGTFEERSTAMRRAWPLRTGMIFQDTLWADSKAALIRELHSKTYPAARIVESLAEVDPDQHTVSLRVVTDSGPAFRFGGLEITGIEALPDQIISGLNPIKPGTPYDEEALQDFQSRLQRTGYFSSVYVTAANDPEQASGVPIRVAVVENTARKMKVGAGYSTDQGAGVELRYEDSLTFRPGWRSVSSLKLEQREQSASTRVQMVPIGYGFQPIISAEVKRTDIQNDQSATGRIVGQLQRIRGKTELSLSLDLNYEWNKTPGTATSDVSSIPLNVSWTRRELDDKIYPRQGYVVNLQAGGATDLIFSNTSFLRLYARGNYYHPLGAHGTLLLRGEIGAVEASTSQDIPSDYLFRAGGSQSVRGYEYGSLGIPDGDAIVPGRYIGVASIEVMHPVAPGWQAALFVDAGNVVDDVKDFKAKLGYGTGIRWASPVGPLNLDLAYGEADATWRVNFSVGSLF
jgi:translocation and assembly module TamA